MLSEIVEEWLDEDTADQTLTLMLMKPDITVDDRGQVKPVVRRMSLNADSFWTEYHDRSLFGLTAEGMTAWTDGENLLVLMYKVVLKMKRLFFIHLITVHSNVLSV